MNARDTATGLWASVTQILQTEMGDWDLSGPTEIGPLDTLRGDLGLDSLGMVRVITAIEVALKRGDIPFERLLVRGGQYVDDLTVADLVGFLAGRA